MDYELYIIHYLLYIADPSVEAVNKYIDKGEIYGAYNDNIIVGVYVLIKINLTTSEIINISVKEEYQSSGIGKALVKHGIEVAKSLNSKVLEVGTGNSSISQLAFYQKCGFRIVGVEKDFYRKNYKENIFENGIECIDMIRLSVDL